MLEVIAAASLRRLTADEISVIPRFAMAGNLLLEAFFLQDDTLVKTSSSLMKIIEEPGLIRFLFLYICWMLEMLDGKHRRVGIPACAWNAHSGLLQKRLEEDRYWFVPHVPPTTQSVKGLGWTDKISIWFRLQPLFPFLRTYSVVFVVTLFLRCCCLRRIRERMKYLKWSSLEKKNTFTQCC